MATIPAVKTEIDSQAVMFVWEHIPTGDVGEWVEAWMFPTLAAQQVSSQSGVKWEGTNDTNLAPKQLGTSGFPVIEDRFRFIRPNNGSVSTTSAALFATVQRS